MTSALSFVFSSIKRKLTLTRDRVIILQVNFNLNKLGFFIKYSLDVLISFDSYCVMININNN